MALAVGLLLAASCRPLGRPPEVPPGWAALEWRGASYVALYRLRCCGQRELLATVRAGTGGFGLTVVAPPGVTVVDGWLDDSGSWLAAEGGRCRQRLPGGSLPLPEAASLPVGGQVVAALLAGRIPPGGAPDADGWVAGGDGGWRWRARVVGAPPRCVAMRVFAARGDEPAMEAVLRGHRGGLPHALVVTVGPTRIVAELREWRSVAQVAPPPWFAAPPCGGEG